MPLNDPCLELEARVRIKTVEQDTREGTTLRYQGEIVTQNKFYYPIHEVRRVTLEMGYTEFDYLVKSNNADCYRTILTWKYFDGVTQEEALTLTTENLAKLEAVKIPVVPIEI